MGLSNALSSALSGLRVTQTGMELVSGNVANARTPGYTRKDAVLDANITAGKISGVRVSQINREIDTYVQRQLRTETSGLAYTGVTSSYLDQLQRLFGTPGGEMSLDTLMNNFTGSLDELVTTPSSTSARSNVITDAKLLAQSLNSASDDIQAMRKDAESGMKDTVNQINAALQGIQKINQQISGTASTQQVPPDYLDQRDELIMELASLMDIKVVENGNDLTITTANGAQLFANGEPASLSFEPSGSMNAQALYNSDQQKSGLGTVLLRGPSGNTTDLLAPNQLQSGKLKAYAQMRDEILVEAQTQLDELASAMAEALGTNVEQGTPVAAAPNNGFSLDLADLSAGNKVSLKYTDATGSHTVTFVRVDDPASLPLSNDLTADPKDRVVGIDFSGGMASVAAQMQAALGAQFNVSAAGSTVTMMNTGAAPTATLNSLSAGVTATGIQDGAGLPLFIDGSGDNLYTGEVDGFPQRLGFAGRIQVNPDVIDDPALLVNYKTPIDSGDATRPTFLRDALENSSTAYRIDTGLGGTTSPMTGSLADFARAAISQQGSNAEIAARVKDGQEVVVTSLADKYAETSAVDVDVEMGKLLQLQSAYGANARVISAVKEMIDTLLQM